MHRPVSVHRHTSSQRTPSTQSETRLGRSSLRLALLASAILQQMYSASWSDGIRVSWLVTSRDCRVRFRRELLVELGLPWADIHHAAWVEDSLVMPVLYVGLDP